MNDDEFKAEIRDVTECCICKEIFNDPRDLPCTHTFCKECLENVMSSLNKNPGDEMPCPVCRTEFIIPLVDGVSGLQRNRVLRRLAEVMKRISPSSSGSKNLCDLCREDTEDNEVPSAEMFCKQCRKKLCKDCLRHHRRSPCSKMHEIVNIESGRDFQAFSSNFCDCRRSTSIEIYCFTCSEAICSTCCLDGHVDHDWKKVDEAEEKCRRTIEENLERMSRCLANCTIKKDELENGKMEILRTVTEVENTVNRIANELKQFIENDVKTLVEKLAEIKQNGLSEMKSENSMMDRHMTVLESYKVYSNEIKTKGTAADICEAASYLTSELDGLVEMHRSFMLRQIPSVSVFFKKAAFDDILEANSIKNLVGEIQDRDFEANEERNNLENSLKSEQSLMVFHVDDVGSSEINYESSIELKVHPNSFPSTSQAYTDDAAGGWWPPMKRQNSWSHKEQRLKRRIKRRTSVPNGEDNVEESIIVDDVDLLTELWRVKEEMDCKEKNVTKHQSFLEGSSKSDKRRKEVINWILPFKNRIRYPSESKSDVDLESSFSSMMSLDH